MIYNALPPMALRVYVWDFAKQDHVLRDIIHREHRPGHGWKEVFPGLEGFVSVVTIHIDGHWVETFDVWRWVGPGHPLTIGKAQAA